MNKNLLSIIIVTFNNHEHITECLNSLTRIRMNHEIIIIDNHSTDLTISNIRIFLHKNPSFTATLITNTFNRGYARAVNQGITKSKGKFLCLLGSDCLIEQDTLEYLADFLNRNPDTGLVAPRLIDHSGDIHASCRRLPTMADTLFELSGLPRLLPRTIKPAWKKVDHDLCSAKEVQQPEASCLMTHREAMKTIGLMDERFPIFFNDVDWCRRFLGNGYKIMYLPQVKVVHFKGGSIYKNRIPMIWKSHQGFYRYFLKYAKNRRQKFFIHSLGFLLIYTAAVRSFVYLLNEPFQKKERK
ncbi:MAG: glycosyltransferase family 2 protein [bacterium]